MFSQSKAKSRNSKLEAPASASWARASNSGLTAPRWFFHLGAMVASWAPARSLFAQGCAMCYTTAASAKAAAIQALRSGILILLIPPVLIAGGIFAMALRSRERFSDDVSAGLSPAEGDPGSAGVSPAQDSAAG